MTTMIKNIIEKVILSTFGRFVRGIDKEKLSVDLFGGNFKLENISLNHQYFDGLNLPFRLVFSSIGTLSLQAPLSKLSSVPVECLLDSIYVIFEFRAGCGESFSNRKQKLLKEVGEVLQGALKKLKQEKKEDGMMARLGRKVVDNLQLRIRNLHLRFEQPAPNPYSWGLTLQEIAFTTTDSQWKPSFIERTNDTPAQLFKMMQLKKLNIYWQAEPADSLLKPQSDPIRRERLAAMVEEEREVVLSITSQFKLIINPQEDTTKPIYELEVKLEPVRLELQRRQCMQMNDFARQNVLQNERIVKSIGRRSKIKITEQEKQTMRNNYEEFIASALLAIENGQPLQQEHDQDDQLREIFEKIEEGELKEWALGPIKRKVKAVREMEIKKKKSGWFSRGDNELSEQEQSELQNFIDSSFEGEKSVRLPGYLLFSVNAEFKGARMVLIEHRGTDIEERIEFDIGKINATVAKSEDQTQFASDLEIASISLSLFIPVQKQGKMRQRKMQIFTSEKPQNYKENDDEQEDSMESFDSAEEESPPSFLQLSYRNELNLAVLRKTVTGRMERITVIYKKIYMEKFRKFFSFKNTGGSFAKTGNLDKSELEDSIKEEENDFKLEKIVDVRLDINSPVFVCPLNEQECWCLNLGSLSIRSSRSEEMEEFPMAVNSAFLRYYPHMKECFDLKRSRLKKGIFSLINDMDFTVNYQRSKKIGEEVLSIQLPSFKVNFTQKQYDNLMSLSKVFKVEEDEKRSMVEQLKEERKMVQDGATWEGSLLKKHETLMSWREYYAIVSKEHLYLYNNRQELRENSKILMKNARVIIKGDTDDTLELQLTNQNQVCYLGCHTKAELEKWHEELDRKCRQFKTIHELIKDYEQRNSESKKRSGSESFSVGQLETKRKILKFHVSEVEFRYQSEQQECLMQFQIKQIDFSRQNMLEWSQKQFSMKTLKITDRLYKYSNPIYQTLLEARGVHFQELKGRKKNEGARRSHITADLEDLYINWKPDVLLILMGLMNQHFQGEKPLRFDDDIEQSREEHFKQVFADGKFMFLRENYREKGKGITVKDRRDQLSLQGKWMRERMKTTVNLRKIEINMFHRESHLVIFKLIASPIDCDFTVCQTAKFVKGTVGTLDLFDMTGYPREDYSANQFHEPYRILTRSPSSNSDPLLEFRWSSYDHNSFPNEQRIDSFIWVVVAPLQYEYYQQITFRLIDYILIQIILLLNQPEMLTVNENLMEQLKKEARVEEKPVKILFSQYEEVIRRLVEPFFMDMYFQLNNPTLVLKAEKSSHIYYKTTMQKLIFFNRTLKKSTRFRESSQQVKDLVYEDEYLVEGIDCHFIEISERKKQTEQLFQPFKIELQINKLIFQDEINLLFPQISGYDRSFLTINRISNIIISHYSRLQYLNINKLVNFNFTFDDLHDELFIHNFKITKLLSPKPILYDVVIPEIHMTADYNARENTEQIWKLFKATINNFKMTYRRTKQLDSSITIGMGLTKITGYEYEVVGKEPVSHYLLTLRGDEEERNSTDILIENKTTGQKIIQMNVGAMNVNVRTGLLQLIFEYTLIEDWVFPTINKSVPEMTFFATVHLMTAQLCEDPRQIAEQLKKKKVHHKIIHNILEGSTDLATFRLQGLMVYKFHRQKGFTTQQYSERLERKEFVYADFEKMEPTSSMSLIVNTQIYRAWVLGKSKRKIVEKFTYTMEDKRYLRVADQKKCTLKTISKRAMNVDRGFLKLSFKDIILLRKILAQISNERAYINFLNAKTGRLQAVSPEALSKQTESSSLQNLDLKVESITFYLINSRRDIFIPILKLSVGGLSLSKANTFKKDILKGDFNLALYYFNNQIFRWEPMLEKAALAFHRLIYYQQNNKVFGSYDCENKLMINISRQICLSLQQTSAAWKKQSQQQQNKFTSEGKEVEPLEFISHYIIRNETGYPIDLLNDKHQLIRRVAHNQQVDYEMQIDNYDEQNENQIFIGFKLIHPRYQFMSICNISLNSEREAEFQPRLIGLNDKKILNLHSKIAIKPEIKDCKKILMIKSSKYIYTYFDGFCEVKALPFDHEEFYTLPKEIHNGIKVSLYNEHVTDYYRYLGKDGILKIMKKYLVYNYSPIPLQICGKIVKPNEYVGISESLRIQDESYKDSILKVIKNQKQKEFYIFAESYIVDYYGLTFDFEKENRKISKMYSHKFASKDIQKAESYTIYILPEAEFKFRVGMGKSVPVSLKTTIGKSSFVLQNRRALCPFAINSYLSSLENTHINEFKRVVEITPEYMLSNATRSLIKICQSESCESITLEPYERLPFFWENREKPKKIRLSSYDGENFWGFSGDLTISKSTETIVLRNASDPTMYRIFSLQIQITNTVTFIHVLQPSPKYLISNRVAGTNLQVYQRAIFDEHIDQEHSYPKEFMFNVRKDEEKAFGYELPLESHVIAVRVELDQTMEEFRGLYCDEILMDDLQSNLDSKKVAVRSKLKDNKKVGQLFVVLLFEDNLKKLRLQSDEQHEQTENSYEYIIKIPQIGISFIGLHNDTRKEILHLMLKTIELQISGNADYSDFNLVVQGCRIENELKYNVIFPVVFQSLPGKKANYFLNFLITRSARNSRLIHYIGCSINRSCLTISSQEVQAMQENISRIKVGDGQIRRCEMFNCSLPDPEESLYFVEAVIHPLKSNVTFKHVNEWGGKLLKTFSSINECPISAEGQKFKHFSCQNLSVFFGLLLKHYQDGLSKMLLPMIGNLTIIGSPITFVQKIGSGFKDLVQLPAEGFQNGPLEGGKGMVRGAKSLLTNTFTGAFNTVESLTGSISNGITLLVDDDNQFSRDRENIKNDRSEHVIDGLANGAKSIAYGIKNGFTGLFTQPVRGAEKNGLPGFLLGAAKGVGGLIIKPISGVIDAASKTAEGIKNTPEYFNDQKQKRFIREHNPRPFYNFYKEFRNYDSQLADLIKILSQQGKQKYTNLSWCGHYFLRSEKQSHRPILILSYEFLFIYDIKRQKLIQHLRCDDLREVLMNEDALRIKIWQRKTNREGYITVVPDGGCRKLASEIKAVIRHFSPNFKFD